MFNIQETDILEIAVSIAPDGQGKFIGLFFAALNAFFGPSKPPRQGLYIDRTMEGEHGLDMLFALFCILFARCRRNVISMYKYANAIIIERKRRRFSRSYTATNIELV